MTKLTGNTPKQGVANHSKQTYHIENRLIGVRIICGADINFMMYVNVDQTIPGGSNLFIDIYRKAIEEVSKRLEKLGQEMPKHMLLQADNCGDNKNKELFSFGSLLVDFKYFDIVDINFLIVVSHKKFFS